MPTLTWTKTAAGLAAVELPECVVTRTPGGRYKLLLAGAVEKTGTQAECRQHAQTLYDEAEGGADPAPTPPESHPTPPHTTPETPTGGAQAAPPATGGDTPPQAAPKTSARRKSSKPVPVATTGPLLGEVITWQTGDAAPIGKVKAALAAAGLDEGLVSDLVARHAFARALKQLETDRLVRQVVEDQGLIKFQVTKEVKLGADELDYVKEAKLTLDTVTGKVSCPQSPELGAKLQDLLDAARETKTPGDVSNVVQRLFTKKADLFPLRRQGAVYFVPAQFEAFTDQVDAFLTALGGGVNRFPVPAGTTKGDKAIAASVADTLQDLLRQHADAVAGLNVNSKADTLKLQAERIAETRVKLDAYAHFLKERHAELEAGVQALEQTLKQRVAELTQQREAKKAAPNGGPVEKDKFGFKVGTNVALLNAALDDTPRGMAEVVKRAGLSGTFYNHLNGLVKAGHVIKTADGKYAVKPATE